MSFLFSTVPSSGLLHAALFLNICSPHSWGMFWSSDGVAGLWFISSYPSNGIGMPVIMALYPSLS